MWKHKVKRKKRWMQSGHGPLPPSQATAESRGPEKGGLVGGGRSWHAYLLLVLHERVVMKSPVR